MSAQTFAAARDICRHHARSFFLASHFLPRPRRDAAYAIYAFCREIDDAVDGGTSIEQARARLANLRARLDQTHAHPTGFELPFEITLKRFSIPAQPFQDLLAGCEMDLSNSRYATWPELELYCSRVAGSVGSILCRVLGATDDSAEPHAVLLGNAMQLTNILRDLAEDWRRGRVYLPLEELQRFGYSVDLLSRGIVNTAFIELMRFQIDRTRELYRQAVEGICLLADDGSRTTAAAMAVLYAGILDAIERQGYDVFSRRATLSLPKQLARMPRVWRLKHRQAGQPLPAVFEPTHG